MLKNRIEKLEEKTNLQNYVPKSLNEFYEEIENNDPETIASFDRLYADDLKVL